MPKFTRPTLTRKWVKLITAERTEHIVEQGEILGETVYTQWTFNGLGPIGTNGTPKRGNKIVPLKTKADFRDAERQERLLDKHHPIDALGEARLAIRNSTRT